MADHMAEESERKIGDKTIFIVNLTPNLSENEKYNRKNDIEQKLYDIFRKYYEKPIKHRD